VTDKETGSSEPVIDLDDTAANRNWLRIVAAMHDYQRGDLTADEYRQRVGFLSDQPPENVRLPDKPDKPQNPEE
jgi:hypothetical protein